MQRAFDLFFSGIALTLLAPLFFPLMVILRFTGEGEIFFAQSRVGRGGKHFKLYKFATMLKKSPNMAMGTVTVKNDPRVLPVGRYLRKLKINELPQLINIYKGDMSIIGPRPQTQRCFDAFPLSSKRELTKVRPGLSGIGSIIFRDEENMMAKSNMPEEFYDGVIMPYKGLLEEWYISRRNIFSYFAFMGLTVWVVLGLKIGFLWRLYRDLPLPPYELRPWIKGFHPT